MLENLFDFILDDENREALAWLGGGLCVVAGALWKVYVARRSKSAAKPADRGNQNSAQNSFAAGRNISVGGNVTITEAKTPLAVWFLGAAGLVLFALALLFAGDRTTVSNGVVTEGPMNNSNIKIETKDVPD